MALAAAMLLFAAYMGAYYALLDGSVRRFTWAARGLPFARDVFLRTDTAFHLLSALWPGKRDRSEVHREMASFPNPGAKHQNVTA